MTQNLQPPDHDAHTQISKPMILLLASACGIVVANLYYAQPIVGVLSREYGLSVSLSGLLITVTQVGYALGLFFVVPLGDIVENRRLIVTLLGVVVVALVLAYAAPTAGMFLAASLALGIASCAVQVIVPFAGHLASDATRGAVVGQVVSGLLFGIMLSRPVASFVAQFAGARTVFVLSAVATLVLLPVMALRLPSRRPVGMPYGRMIASLWPLLRDTKVLQRRGAYQAAMFGAFSLFWTAVPLLLEGPAFGLSQIGIGFFALVGAGGALISPYAGRAADAGHARLVTLASLATGVLSFVIALAGGLLHSLALVVVAAVALDTAVAANLVTGQREIFALAAEARGRLNGLFLALFFLGGAVGSAVAGIAMGHGGWSLASLAGALFPAAALLYLATEDRR